MGTSTRRESRSFQLINGLLSCVINESGDTEKHPVTAGQVRVTLQIIAARTARWQQTGLSLHHIINGSIAHLEKLTEKPSAVATGTAGKC